MKVSAGVIFYTKDNKVLLAHATGQKHWDIPKGQPEEGEDFIDAAIRECEEEIGFLIEDKDYLKALGIMDYNSQKKLALFLYIGTEFPKAEACICSSFFTDRWKNEVLEVDDFKYISLDQIDEYATKNLTKTLRNAIEKAKEKFDFY